MKTLLLSEIFPPQHGGSGRWFWEIYRRLDPADFVMAVGQHLDSDAFDADHSMQIHRLALSMPQWGIASVRGAKDYIRNIANVRRLIRSEGVSMIHAGRCLPEGVIALSQKLMMGTPYVCYVHGEDVNTSMNSREHQFLVRRVLRNAEYCIANSQNSAELLDQYWSLPKSKVKVLHPGVDTNRFVPKPRSIATRRTLGWGDRRVILTVGRLQARKGHDMMIRALPTIRKQIPDVLYVIVGSGEELDRLKALATKLDVSDCVKFQGEPDDETLIDCYQQCDVFALPNREVDRDIEGFGMVLIEAQSCGRPVIAGKSGGTRETMRPDRTGYLVDCRLPEPIAECLTCLLDQPDRRQRMGNDARQWVVENFDWNSLSRQAEHLFDAKQHAHQSDEKLITPHAV